MFTAHSSAGQIVEPTVAVIYLSGGVGTLLVGVEGPVEDPFDELKARGVMHA